MGRLDNNTILKRHLHDNKPFRYAHLVKFERPALEEDITPPNEALRFDTGANKYAYFTDAPFDIKFQDGSKTLAGVTNSTQTYVANRVEKIGSLSESTQVKMGTASISLDATAPHINVKGDYTYLDNSSGNTITITSTTTDYSAEGFREDDKIKIPLGTVAINNPTSNSTAVTVDNFDNANRVAGLLVEGASTTGHLQVASWSGNDLVLSSPQSLPDNEIMTLFNYARIINFTNGGKTINAVLIDGALVTGGSTRTYNNSYYGSVSQTQGIRLNSEEVNYLLQGTMPTNYVNRQVWIWKIFLDEVTGEPIALTDDGTGNQAILLFQGIITSAQYKESETKATMNWSCKSHWGDFKRLSGRITSADFHQALTSKGEPNSAATIKPTYASDYGFMWAERAINLLVKYMDKVEDQRQIDINGWWAGGKRMEKFWVDVERAVDIRFDLSAKYLPTIYGVRKVKPNPVFADIGAGEDNSNCVYMVDALCEGPIQSVMNLYVENSSLVCVDQADKTARASSDAADLVCFGRQDKGEVLRGDPNTDAPWEDQTDNTVSITIATPKGPMQVSVPESVMDEIIDISEGGDGTAYPTQSVQSIFHPIIQSLGKQNSTTTGGSTQGGAGITHERVLPLDQPMDQFFEFHHGVANQTASPMLVAEAQGTGFRLQKSVYADTLGNDVKYWGPNHRLLDTAYVARKCTIAPGETTVPNVEYTVKGKMISCYNYDNSFAHDDSQFSSEANTNFILGDTVDLFKTSDNSSLAANVTVKDKFYLYDSFGRQHYRYRWSVTSTQADNLVSAGKFYMQHNTDSSKKWHMLAHDANEASGFTVAEIGVTQVNNDGAGIGTTTAGALKVALVSAPTGFSDYFTSGEPDTLGQFVGLTNPATTSANYNGNEIFSNNSVIKVNGDYLEFTHNSANIYPSIVVTNTVLVTNKLTLSSGASSTNDFYNDMWIEVTKLRANGNQIIRRKIIDYNGSTKVATLDTPFQSGIDMPKPGETVRIMRYNDLADPSSRVGGSSVPGTDIRASTNFALILLDYLTDVRYGPNISLDDIDLDSFLYAAQVCDTGSDITVQLNTGASGVQAGDVYKYAHTTGGVTRFKWQGTVVDYNTATKKITFTDCIGKLTHRYNDWRSREIGDVVYSNDESEMSIKRITAAGIQSSFNNNAATIDDSPGLKLSRVEGSGDTNLLVLHEIGNPVEYSLYDSDDCKYWAYLGWNSQDQRWVTRHQGNMKIENSTPVFDNIKGILEHFNGMLSYTDGKYRLEVEVTRTSNESNALFTDTAGGSDWDADSGTGLSELEKDLRIRYIKDEDLIGNITIKDSGLDKSYNSLSANLPDPMLHFDNRSVSFFDSNYLKADRGIVKSTNFTAAGITNYFNARMMVKQKLDKSRFNREISFTMRPSGINITPGELIRIESSRYGWDTAKMFRVTNLTMQEDCKVGIVAEEYDDSVYRIFPPKNSRFAVEEEVTGVIAAPNAPTSLVGTDGDFKGRVKLTWAITTANEAKLANTGHYEIWRSGDNNRANAVIVGLANKGARVYEDNVGSGTYYYWIRARNQMPRQNAKSSNALTYYYSSYFPVSATGGEAGSTTDVTDGTSNAIIYAYKRAASTPSDNPGAVAVVSLTTGTITTPSGDSLSNDWKKTVPASSDTTAGTDIYWVAATVSGTGSTDNIAANEWSSPALLTSEGTRARTIYLYQRTATNSAPSAGGNSGLPAGDSTWYWAATGGNAANSLAMTTANGWSTTIPDNANSYLWMTFATAAGRKNALQDTIPQSEWAAPQKISENGVSARAVKLTTDKQAFTYVKNSDGSAETYTGSAATVTAGFSNSELTNPYFKWYIDGTFQSSLGTQATSLSYTPTTAHTSMPQKIKVELYEDSGRSTKLAEDEMTMFALVAGSDSITVSLSNENHGCPKTATGTTTLSGSGTDIKVWWGATPLEVGDGNGTFNITGTPSASGCTYGGVSGSPPDDYTIRVNNLSAIAASAASITYTLRVTKIGSSENFTRVQSFTVSQDGSAGQSTNFVFKRASTMNTSTNLTANGLNPPTGWDDEPGGSSNSQGTALLWSAKGTIAVNGTAYSWGKPFQVEGSAVAELRAYSDVVANNGNSPTKPSNGQSTWNATTNVVTLNNSSWNNTPPSVSSNGDTVYQCSALVNGGPLDTAVGINWTDPAIFTRKTDGTPGNPGSNGTNGSNGTPGAAGTPGGDGSSVAIMFIFKRASSQPSTPSGSTFNFSTMAWSGISGWYDNIDDVGGADTTPIWQSRAMFVYIDGGSSSPGPNSAGWSTPKTVYKAGADGSDGTDGTPGSNGSDGSDGATGPTGPTGPGGSTGPTGPGGSTGPTGPGGATGAAGWSVSASHSSVPLYDTSSNTAAGGSGSPTTVSLYASNGSTTNNFSFVVTALSTYNSFSTALSSGASTSGWSGWSAVSGQTFKNYTFTHSASGVSANVVITRIISK